MKKQLQNLPIYVIVLYFAITHGFSQWTPNSVTVMKTDNAPVIDGQIDAEWFTVQAQDIVSPFGTETVSFTDDPTFKAMWDDQNIYILLEVPDDNWYPHTEAGVNSWQADKPELYFDVNEIRVDGGGPSDDPGHIQIAPGVDQIGSISNYSAAYQVDANDAAYIFEYAIPFSILYDNLGNSLDPTVRSTIGFDINIIDLDEAGKGGNTTMGRICWSNNVIDAVDGGVAGESWITLDQTGDFIFESFDPDRDEPYAKAGANQLVIEGQQVNLDGSASFDNQDGSITRYEWAGPPEITIINADAALASFIAPDVEQNTIFTLSLTVYDVASNSNTDYVNIEVIRVNNRPTANAGGDISCVSGDTIAFDGSASSDPDNDELNFYWSSLNGLSLEQDDKEIINWIAPDVNRTTTFEFGLMVGDGEAFSTTDIVAVTVEKKEITSLPVNTAEKLIVSPNPSNDIVTIRMKAVTNPHIRLISIDGKIIEEFSIYQSHVEEIELDVSGYQSGAYILVVYGGSNIRSNKLLVK